jgi:hypothetical protein
VAFIVGALTSFCFWIIGLVFWLIVGVMPESRESLC